MDEETDEEFDDDVEKRFGCAECGHTFCPLCFSNFYEAYLSDKTGFIKPICPMSL